jgi:heptaprenyl diphosphate synthase
MYGLRRLCGANISLAGISVAGAFVSNGVQLVLARFFLFGESAVYLAPPFLAAGIVSGAVLGIFAGAFAAQSRFLQGVAGAQEPPRPASVEGRISGSPYARCISGSPRPRPARKALLLFFFGIAAAALFPAIPLLAVKAALFFLFCLLAALTGKKPRLLVTAAVMAGIVICNLFPPFGRVLFEAGPFTIALGSLESGVRKAVNLEGLVMLSKLVVPATPELPGAFGKLLAETFRVLERFNKYRGLFTGKNHKNAADNPERKQRFMERLDLLLLKLSGR